MNAEMQELLIVTGACGVGKSTVSRIWAKRRQGVALEADYFTEWIYSDSFERFTQQEERLVANITAVTTMEYLNQGFPVAIEGVWSPYGLEILKARFEREAAGVPAKWIRLYCEIEENHRRDRLRPPENQMKSRVDTVNKELGHHSWGSYLHLIDSTHLSAEETVAKIERLTFSA